MGGTQAAGRLEADLSLPSAPGAFARHPFGIDVDEYSTFDGLGIPSRGRGGWFFGADRRPEGTFFHYEIADLGLQGSRGRER